MDRLGQFAQTGASHNGAHATPAMRESHSREVISMTPIPKLDHAAA